MIHFLTSADRTAPIRLYCKDWSPRLARRVRILAYEDRPDPGALPDGPYVFADVDRLAPDVEAIARALWETLAARGERVRLLNRPGVTMRRVELLHALHARGWNRFGARAAGAPRDGLRYPVFVRHAVEHEGAFTPLLPDACALDEALAKLVAAGRRTEDLLVVEFLDTRGADGLYRKYAATIVGERIVPHHVLFGRDWEVKAPSLVAPALLEENRAFQRAHPHASRLREIFRLARVEWGRIDYALCDGELQVWEINTNPTLLSAPRRYVPAQLPARRWFAARLDDALRALDAPSTGRTGWLERWLRP